MFNPTNHCVFAVGAIMHISEESKTVALKLQHASESPGDLVEHSAGLHHRVSNSVRLEWGPRNCVSNKLPGDADAAGPWSTL